MTSRSHPPRTPAVFRLDDPARIALMTRIDYSKVDLADWNDQWNRIIAR